MHGRSVVPLLSQARSASEGRTASTAYTPRRSFLIEYFSDKVFPRVQNMGYQAVRSDRWKYIHYVDLADADELYDLASDPYELKNLFGDPAQRDTVATMQTELRRLIAETP